VTEDAPKVEIEAIHHARTSGSGHWSFTWRIRNLTDRPIKFLAARLPHGQFRSQERAFNPPLEAASGANVEMETSVLCAEPAGTVIENAFLILLTEWQESRWRIFARLRMTMNQREEPEAVTELVTTQQVGFSGLE
jgi:hypothetical protein